MRLIHWTLLCLFAGIGLAVMEHDIGFLFIFLAVILALFDEEDPCV